MPDQLDIRKLNALKVSLGYRSTKTSRQGYRPCTAICL